MTKWIKDIEGNSEKEPNVPACSRKMPLAAMNTLRHILHFSPKWQRWLSWDDKYTILFLFWMHTSPFSEIENYGQATKNRFPPKKAVLKHYGWYASFFYFFFCWYCRRPIKSLLCVRAWTGSNGGHWYYVSRRLISLPFFLSAFSCVLHSHFHFLIGNRHLSQ